MAIKYCNTMFKIGDLVKIVNAGSLYSTYTRAFEYFGIGKHIHPSNLQRVEDEETYLLHLGLRDNVDVKHDKWVVINVVQHMNGPILYLIADSSNNFLVIGENGLKLIRHTSQTQYNHADLDKLVY
jgi:PP-loop superfamily ATP-utilizing enzyme